VYQVVRTNALQEEALQKELFSVGTAGAERSSQA
jgi:hypothetical protein